MNNRYKLLVCSLFVLIASAACDSDKYKLVNPQAEIEDYQNAEIKIVHPGALHTAEDFEFIKGKLAANASPWTEGYGRLNTSTHLTLSYNARPSIKLIRGGGSTEEPEPDNYTNAMRDAHAAYQMGLKWRLTGDAAWAAKGIEILNAWARTCQKISGDSNRALAAGIYGFAFANAAEVLRDYEGWASTDFKAYQAWMVDVFYTVNMAFLQTHWGTCNFHYWTNWDAANMCSVLAIGILTDDRSKVSYAINYFKRGIGNGNINNAVTHIHNVGGEILGQGQESGRDQGHGVLVISLLGSFCQMAYNVGEDLFAYQNNKFLALCEYTAKYNYADGNGLFPFSVPFSEYTRRFNANCSGTEVHTVVSSIGRGEIRPAWELVYNHYVKVKGLNAKYSQMFAEKVRPEGGGSHYSPNSGGYDQLGFGTLMFSRE